MKTLTFFATASTAIALTLGAPSLLAYDYRVSDTEYVDKLFDRYDTNADGILTEAEVQTAHETFFADADSDNNGLLSAEELDAAREARRRERHQERFTTLDTDADGVLNVDEFLAGLQPSSDTSETKRNWRLNWIDRDRDGQISLQELTYDFPYFRYFDADGNGEIVKDDVLNYKSYRGHRGYRYRY